MAAEVSAASLDGVRDRNEPAAQYGSSPDSPLDESGFEPGVAGEEHKESGIILDLTRCGQRLNNRAAILQSKIT
jgi:hypothetical protein